jgi:hypothetical protein
MRRVSFQLSEELYQHYWKHARETGRNLSQFIFISLQTFCLMHPIKNDPYRKELEQPNSNDKGTFIYLFLDKTGKRYKVGKTHNIKKRLRNLSTTLGMDIEIVDSFQGESIDELILHRKLENYQIRTEWFHECSEVKEIFKNYKLSRSGT